LLPPPPLLPLVPLAVCRVCQPAGAASHRPSFTSRRALWPCQSSRSGAASQSCRQDPRSPAYQPCPPRPVPLICCATVARIPGGPRGKTPTVCAAATPTAAQRARAAAAAARGEWWVRRAAGTGGATPRRRWATDCLLQRSNTGPTNFEPDHWPRWII
jgi:hypothetical protein